MPLASAGQVAGLVDQLAQHDEAVAGAIVTVAAALYRRRMGRSLSSRTRNRITSVLTTLIQMVVTRADPGRTHAARERLTLSSVDDAAVDSDAYDIAIWTSRRLARRRGRTAERMVARTLAAMMDVAGIDYRIQTGFGATPDPSGSDGGLVSVDTLNWWRSADGDRITTAADANLLLVDFRGGGWAAQGGKFAISGANRIDRLVDIARHAPRCPRGLGDGGCGNLRAAVHEIGHNLGGRHDTPMLAAKPALAWTDAMVGVLKMGIRQDGGSED